MESILEHLPHLAGYKPALIAMGVLVLAVTVQSFLAGILALAPGHEVAGMPLKGTHDDRSFRIMRAYANSTENLPMMLGAFVLAILAGVSFTLVNWLVIIHLACRLIHWFVYYSKIGKRDGGPRTISYVGGLLTNIILGVMAVWALVA
jgi:uncharacterized MAPEG superfamily protein